MSDIAERMKQAHDTLRETLGTPYEANARAALRELIRRARGGPAPKVPRVTLKMRNRVHDLRHARTHEVPSSAHPWRGYPRMGVAQRGGARADVVGSFLIALVVGALVGGVDLLLFTGATLAIVGLLLLVLRQCGYSLLPPEQEGVVVAEARVWKQKRRELAASIEARRVLSR